MLETAKTDEFGKAIHENCYLLKISLRRASSGEQWASVAA
jgi:hypothetical protein